MCTKTELGYGLLDPIEKKLIEYLFPDLDCLPLANTEWGRVEHGGSIELSAIIDCSEHMGAFARVVISIPFET